MCIFWCALISFKSVWVDKHLLDGTHYNEHLWLNATTPDVTVVVPVGVSHDADFVEFGTVAVITSVFVYLLWVFTATARRMSRVDSKDKTE